MKVTVLLADDEPVARAGLRDMLSTVEWMTCVGEAANGPAAVEGINTLRPELVFLDIQMPGLLGTEVLRRVQHQPFVVFTTAFAHHAVTAFERSARLLAEAVRAGALGDGAGPRARRAR